MAARTAQFALLVDQLVAALRAKPPVPPEMFLLLGAGQMFVEIGELWFFCLDESIRRVLLIYFERIANGVRQRVMSFLRKVQPIQSVPWQRKHIGQEMLRYQYHIVFLGETSLCVPETVAEQEERKFEHNNLAVPFLEPAKEFIELGKKCFAVGSAQQVITANFDENQRIAFCNTDTLAKRAFNGRAGNCQVRDF
jgi:hypothetical protein